MNGVRNPSAWAGADVRTSRRAAKAASRDTGTILSRRAGRGNVAPTSPSLQPGYRPSRTAYQRMNPMAAPVATCDTRLVVKVRIHQVQAVPRLRRPPQSLQTRRTLGAP